MKPPAIPTTSLAIDIAAPAVDVEATTLGVTLCNPALCNPTVDVAAPSPTLVPVSAIVTIPANDPPLSPTAFADTTPISAVELALTSTTVSVDAHT